MGKKKKKKGRKSPKKQHQLHDLTRDQLIRTGTQHLQNDKARDAISVFKFVVNRHGMAEDIRGALFRAYLIRADELRRKNLDTEAETVIEQAKAYAPDITEMSEADLRAYIRSNRNAEAFRMYARFVKKGKPSPEIERLLADHLIRETQWDWLEPLDAPLSITRDAPHVRKAMPLLDAGKWEDALKCLTPVPRTSPFAPLRLFCRGMAAFLAEDDSGARRAFSLIPEDFPLSKAAQKAEAMLENAHNPEAEADHFTRLFWDGPLELNREIESLLHYIEKKQTAPIGASIRKIADTLSPKSPEPVRRLLVETLWPLTVSDFLETHVFHTLVRKLLSEKTAKKLTARIEAYDPDSPLYVTGYYLTEIAPLEFPDEEDRNIAHALLLLNKVNHLLRIYEEYGPDEELTEYGVFRDILGIQSDRYELIMLDLIRKSIEMDPGNRNAYDILVQIPGNSREAKKKIEAALLAMTDRFPDDPFPCLELAELYYSSGAFRKAENILKEAMRRAPHDARVIDRHVIALLFSAEKNFGREKFHLVERDLKKAQELDSRKIAPFVAEKTLLLHLMHTDGGNISADEPQKQLGIFGQGVDLTPLVEEILEPFAPVNRIRILSFLIRDIEKYAVPKYKTVLTFVEKQLKKLLRQIGDLSSAEAVSLLSPADRHLEKVLPSWEPAEELLKRSPKLLSQVQTAEVFPLYEMIFDPKLIKTVKKDIKQRRKKAGPADVIRLDFYLNVFRFIAGEIKSYSTFHPIIEKAGDGPLHEELRTAARRLAKKASGPFRMNLEHFDFHPFSPFHSLGGFEPDFDMDFEPDFEPDEEEMAFFDEMMMENSEMRGALLDAMTGVMNQFDMPEEEIESMIDEVEALVDELGLRGLSTPEIRNMKKNAMEDMEVADAAFEMMGTMIRAAKAGGRLTREAQILLYGKRV